MNYARRHAAVGMPVGDDPASGVDAAPVIEIAWHPAAEGGGAAPALAFDDASVLTAPARRDRLFALFLTVSTVVHIGVAAGFALYDRARIGMAGGQEIPVEIVVETIDNSPGVDDVRLDIPAPDLPPELNLPSPEPELVQEIAQAPIPVELPAPEPPPPLSLPEPEPAQPVQTAEAPPIELPAPEPPPPLVLPEPEPEPTVQVAEAPPVELPAPEPPPPLVLPEPEPVAPPPVQVAEIQLPDVELPPPEAPPPLFLPKPDEPPAPVQMVQAGPIQPPRPAPKVQPKPEPDPAARREEQTRKAAEQARLKREQDARRQAQAQRDAAAKAAAASAAPRPAAASAGDIASFRSRVAGKLAASKRYPDAARSRGATGVATVSFRIDASGNPSGVALTRSSGHADLDAETLAMVRRAAPFPPPPPGAPTTFSVPVGYNLR